MKDQRIGETLGNYRLIRRIGRGHFANVYLGQHIFLKIYAAIKILHSSLGESALDGFVHEAQTIATLKHPHIVRVQEFGVEESSDTPFLVMDYAPHGSLRERHSEGETLPLNLIVRYVQQVASALAYAHEARLIHRDVKPENILLSATNELLLSDFSLVTVAHSSASLKTIDNSGTVHYMAPEQIQGRPRQASDQYSLGIMAYEWLCGERPFDGSTSIEIAFKHLNSSLPPLHEKLPSVDGKLESVIHRALAKNPKQRFPDIQSFAEALEEAAQQANSQKRAQEVTTEKNLLITQENAVESIQFIGNETAYPIYSTNKDGKAPTYITLLDIGTACVRAAIVKISKGRSAEVLGIGRQKQKEQAMAAGVIMNTRNVKNACWEAMRKAQQMAGGLITSKTYIGISSELIRGSSLTVHKERKQPTSTITLEEWEKIVAQALMRLKQRQEQQWADDPECQGMPMEAVDVQSSSIRIDGQTVNNPIGRSGQDIYFDIFATFAPIHIYEDINKVAREISSEETTVIVSTPYALAIYLQMMPPVPEDAIIIDIGSETTKISLIRDKEIRQTQAFAFGGEAFTYHLSTQFNMEQRAAEILKLKYSHGQLPTERQKYVQSLLAVEYEEWFDTVTEHLHGMARGQKLPATIYIAGNGLSFPDACIRLRTFPWSKYLPFEQLPGIVFMDEQESADIQDTKNLLRDNGDTIVMALAAGSIRWQNEEQARQQQALILEDAQWENITARASS